MGICDGQLVADGDGRAVSGNDATLSGQADKGGQGASRSSCGCRGLAWKPAAAEQRWLAGTEAAVSAYVPDVLRRPGEVCEGLGQSAERLHDGRRGAV